MQTNDKILQYLKPSLENGLLFRKKKGDFELEDIYWCKLNNFVTDRRSIFGHCEFLG